MISAHGHEDKNVIDVDDPLYPHTSSYSPMVATYYCAVTMKMNRLKLQCSK